MTVMGLGTGDENIEGPFNGQFHELVVGPGARCVGAVGGKAVSRCRAISRSPIGCPVRSNGGRE